MFFEVRELIRNCADRRCDVWLDRASAIRTTKSRRPRRNFLVTTLAVP